MSNCNRRDGRLKRCPLCGTEASITSPIGGIYNIGCGFEDDGSDGCSLVLFGGSGDTMAQMIEKWNKREEVSSL